jgi:hypothetical protein
LADYCDGENFKNHPLFSVDPTALQITLYYDEIEIVNPLGSKTFKNKLGMFLARVYFFYFVKDVKILAT